MSPHTCRPVIRTVVLALLLAASLSIVCVRAQPGPDDVQCYTASPTCSSAGGPPVFRTREDCCLGDGLSYSLFDDETCNICVVFGFNVTALTASERRESYPIEVGYHKGRMGYSMPLPRATNVRISVTPISALSDEFIIQPRLFNFISEFRSRTLHVYFVEDVVALEPDETFTIGLMADGLPFGAFLVDSAELTIIDGDRPLEISFTEDEYWVLESDLLMPVVVTKNSIIASDITLTVTPLTVAEAEARGIQAPNVPPQDPSGFLMLGLENTRARSDDPADFIADPQTITFFADEGVPGASPVRDIRVPVVIFDDATDEPDEEVFVVSLSVQSIGANVSQGAVVIRRDASLCRIADDDSISIGFERDCYTVEEVERAAISDLIFLVRQDNRTEVRGFIVVVQAAAVAPPGASPATLGTSGADGDYSVGPASGSLVLIFASDAEDYRVAFLFNTFDDSVTEGLEAFQLTVEPHEVGPRFTPADGVTMFQNIFVKIIDDDNITVGYESNYTVAESTGFVEVCISVTFPPSPNDTILNGFQLVAGTEPGTADGFDYIPVAPLGVTPFFDDRIRRRCFTLIIITDNVFEETEKFSLSLVQGVDPPDERIIVRPDVAFIRILDATGERDIVFGFDPASYVVSEAAGSVEITVRVLEGQLSAPLVLRVFNEDQTAEAPSDYTAFDVELAFEVGDTIKTFTVDIIDDDAFENDERFLSRRQLVSENPSDRISVAPDTADVTILDDDGVVIGFDRDSYTVSEASGAVTLTVSVLAGDLQRNVAIVFSTSDGTATATALAPGADPGDYEATMMVLTFWPDNLARMVTVPFVNDSIFEGNEHFFGNLATSAGPIRGVTLQPSLAEVLITDDDDIPQNAILASVSVTSPATAGAEYSATCSITVSVLGLTGTPTASWESSNGSPASQGDGITVTESGPTSILTFSPLRTSHAGLYRCAGSLQSPAVPEVITMTPHNISVQIPPPTISITKQLVDANTLFVLCTIILIPAVDTEVTVIPTLIGPGRFITLPTPTRFPYAVSGVTVPVYYSSATVSVPGVSSDDLRAYRCSASVMLDA